MKHTPKMRQSLGNGNVDTAKKAAGQNWLTGQFLIAMPTMIDPRFEKTVILICSHGPEGAMGIVINRMFGDLNFRGLLSQFNIALRQDVQESPVFYGGPVDPIRGFVLHSTDYKRDGTTVITPNINLTATVEILQAIADGEGPQQSLLVLGYAGWGAGQLEMEIQSNGWLTAPATPELVFDGHIETKWQRALGQLGIAPSMLSTDVGHA